MDRLSRLTRRAARRRRALHVRILHRIIKDFTAVSVYCFETKRMKKYKGPKHISWPVVQGVMGLIRAGYHESVAQDAYFRSLLYELDFRAIYLARCWRCFDR